GAGASKQDRCGPSGAAARSRTPSSIPQPLTGACKTSGASNRYFTSMGAPAVPRKLISSGSYLEPEIGFSRAVRVGQFVVVAGTAPIAAAGGTAAPGDVYGQTIRCLEIVGKAVA